MDVRDAGVAQREWMKWAIERDVGWEEKGEDSNKGKREACLTTDYTYILAWVLCIAFSINLYSLLSELSFGGSHCWNTEMEEHPDHPFCMRNMKAISGGGVITFFEMHTLVAWWWWVVFFIWVQGIKLLLLWWHLYYQHSGSPKKIPTLLSEHKCTLLHVWKSEINIIIYLIWITFKNSCFLLSEIIASMIASKSCEILVIRTGRTGSISHWFFIPHMTVVISTHDQLIHFCFTIFSLLCHRSNRNLQ